MSSLNGKNVAIVGGGPGGLTLARLLQLQGANVSVYERDINRDARVTGSALDLHPESGLAAIEAAGLTEGFWARHRPELSQLRILNERADVLYDFQRGASSGVQRPEIERAPLRELLLDSLAPGTVHWDHKLESASLEGESVKLEFASGETVLADFVIGADGARSRLRALVTPIRPSYAGVSLWEGSVPNAEATLPEILELLEGSAMIGVGKEKTLGMATKADGSLLFYAGMKSPSESAQNQLATATSADERVTWFQQHFAGWAPLWESLFAHSEPLTLRPLLVCPEDQHWESMPNVTLIGDAAHVMPPYAGEGVNMAMLDALVLSRELATNEEAGRAIAAYEAEMFSRMAGMLRQTMENTELFYAPDAGHRLVEMFQRFAQMAAAMKEAADTA